MAQVYIEHSRGSRVGVATIRSWTQSLPAGAAILDLGCGPGGPRSEALLRDGFTLYGVDASPTLAKAYQKHLSTAQVACEPAEDSSYFGRTFEGVLAWGLIFLLPAETQYDVILRVARAMSAPGRFLFTAPAQACTWNDLTTGRPSRSLGASRYIALLAEAGLAIGAQYRDEGENHYYDAFKE